MIDMMELRLLCKHGGQSLFLILRKDGRRVQSLGSGVRSAQGPPSALPLQVLKLMNVKERF